MGKQLPKHVVFKGDNGKYMGACNPDGTEHVYLQFYVIPKDKHDRRCSHTIYNNGDGTIRIKSDYYNKFWRLSPNWIWVDSNDQSRNNRDTMFRLVKIDGEDMYALQSVSNGNYCRRITCDDMQSCLNAYNTSFDGAARLKMEEAVLSRRIYNVRYRTEDAKIHGEKLNTMITQEAVNRGSRDNKETISLRYKVSRATKWDSSVTTTIEAGIPAVVNASVEISTEFTYSHAWGQADTRSEEQSTQYEVIVPPNTMVKVRMLATEATLEVPFTYSQEDVLYSGEKVVYHFYDGVYRGVNSYGFKVHVSEQKL